MNIFQGYRKCIVYPVILLSLLVFSESCKKTETETPIIPPQTTPVFALDHIFISVGGKDYIQFVTRCTSETVKLDTAGITDPLNNLFYYEYYSDTTDYQIFCKDESFTFPEDFLKQPGIWKFTFIGKRYSDNSDFTSTVNDTIPN
jgi:hypothetical protein